MSLEVKKESGWVSRIYLRLASLLDYWTQRILTAHEAFPTVHRHGEAPLPSMSAVIAVLNNLFAIISPGYGNRELGKPRGATDQIRRRIARAHEQLTALIARDLRFATPKEAWGQRRFRSEARVLARAFINRIPELVRRLEEDIAAMFLNDPAAKSLELILLCYPGVRAIRVYRIAHELHRMGLILVPRMMTEYAHSRTGVDIHPGAAIGRRFGVDHGTGLVIGETTIIGDDVTCFQGVTIGARKFPRDEHGSVRHDAIKRHPTIGNRVVIYANATIIGGETTIGDDAVIGASTWIEESIEPGIIVTNEKPTQRLVKLKNRLQPRIRIDDEAEAEAISGFIARIERADDL